MSEPAFGEPGWRQTLGTTVVHKCNNCGIVTPAPELEVARMEVERLREALEGEWERNHWDTCGNMKDCASHGGTQRCEYPRPAVLKASDGGGSVPAT